MYYCRNNLENGCFPGFQIYYVQEESLSNNTSTPSQQMAHNPLVSKANPIVIQHALSAVKAGVYFVLS